MNTSRRFSLTLLILIISSCASRLELDRGYSFQDLETGFNLNEIWSDQIYYDGDRLDMVYVMKDTVSLNYFIILASNVKGGYSYTPKFITDSSKLDPRDSINYSRIEYGHIEYEVDSAEITFQIENYLKIVPKKGQIISGAYDYDGAYGHYLTLEYSADSLKGALPRAWRINEENYKFIPLECDSLFRDMVEIFCLDK
jgi:hypothetical protein